MGSSKWEHNLTIEDTFNMGERGFVIGVSANAVAIIRGGRQPPLVIQDETREILTVTEHASEALCMFPSFAMFEVKYHYKCWHIDTSDPGAAFAYSPHQWTDDELGLKWLHHFVSCTKERESSNGGSRILIIERRR